MLSGSSETLIRRTPLKRGGPLQRKAQPVRTAMKRRPKKRATSAEKRHMDRIAQMGCLVCARPAEIHHVTSDGDKRISRSNMLVAPLCPDHHRLGPDAVESVSHAGFQARFGINLFEWAQREALITLKESVK